MNSIIIIPALDPDPHLIAYTDDLIRSGASQILIVNDGSSSDKKAIFDELSLRPECHILTHKINRGKGRALKDAFSYVLNTDAYKGKPVITADSDGQHLVPDILHMDACMTRLSETEKDYLVLGCRCFDEDHVPWRSRFGNRLTSALFKLLYHETVTDTQTGLRGISNHMLEAFSRLEGERFEYEMNMLIDASLRKIPIKTVEIETVYLDHNTGSHFRPLVDSFRVYRILFGTFLKYSISSLVSALLDLSVFALADHLLAEGPRHILTATIIARILSSLFNYWCNKNLVFESGKNTAVSFLQYYTLCIVVMFCSAGLVTLFSPLPIPNTVIKIFVDAVLYVFNYIIQKRFIFKRAS